MAVARLALKSLYNRRFTVLLTVLAIALSVTLLLGVEKLRTEARASFANTISGTDLVVGARSGSVQLLLYSVFRIGSATNNISWDSYQDILGHPRVTWAIPISLGDSHRGYPVLGTSLDYFEHYRFARDRRLELAEGRVFDDVFDAVLGAEVAEKLGYRLDEQIVVAHGGGQVSFLHHDDKPFRVVGILERTGTPVDRTVHVSLEGMEAMHIDWVGGAAPRRGARISAEEARAMDLTPTAITAVLLGLDSRIATFQVQRFINEYRHEPLLAILPGVALQELWDLMGVAERALLVVSAFVVLVGLTGMLTVILASLNERRREMAILRSVGARPLHVFALFMSESALLALLGVLLGVGLLYGTLFVAQPLIADRFGLFVAIGMLSAYDLSILGVVLVAALIIGAIPSYRAYRYSLADGLTIRV
jgi:putative ABC transport system permease protein